MGAIADAVLKAGGEAIGVIPEHLMTREIGHNRLTKLHIVHSMHERKALMADLSDAFIALPGGFGTADEFFEILTWAQLKLHAKPVGLLGSQPRPCMTCTVAPVITASTSAISTPVAISIFL